jgi:hypothetical protein
LDPLKKEVFLVEELPVVEEMKDVILLLAPLTEHAEEISKK